MLQGKNVKTISQEMWVSQCHIYVWHKRHRVVAKFYRLYHSYTVAIMSSYCRYVHWRKFDIASWLPLLVWIALVIRVVKSQTSDSALLSIAVTCISIAVVKKTMSFHRVWDFGLLYGVIGYKLVVRVGFSFLKLRIDEFHSSILRLRALFSRSFSELSALINNSETYWRGVLQFERTTDVYQTERETRQKIPSFAQ